MEFCIYVISLEEDRHRRKAMKCRFIKEYNNFNFVNAVNGKLMNVMHYYAMVMDVFLKCKKLLSPSEVACSESHMEALSKFLKTKCSYALILEDDVIGNDESIASLKKILPIIPSDAIIICGGQEGLRGNRFIYGKPISNNENFFYLSKYSVPYISRACSYLVTRDSAEIILSSQKKCMLQADNWQRLLVNVEKVIYTQLFSHPIDLHDSKIEAERMLAKSRSLWNRLKQEGILFTLWDNIKKRLFLPVLIIIGFKRIRFSEGFENKKFIN